MEPPRVIIKPAFSKGKRRSNDPGKADYQRPHNTYIIRKLKDFAVHARQKAIILTGQDETVPGAIREDLTIFRQGLPLARKITACLERAGKGSRRITVGTLLFKGYETN